MKEKGEKFLIDDGRYVVSVRFALSWVLLCGGCHTPGNREAKREGKWIRRTELVLVNGKGKNKKKKNER